MCVANPMIDYCWGAAASLQKRYGRHGHRPLRRPSGRHSWGRPWGFLTATAAAYRCRQQRPECPEQRVGSSLFGPPTCRSGQTFPCSPGGEFPEKSDPLWVISSALSFYRDVLILFCVFGFSEYIRWSDEWFSLPKFLT